MAASILGAWAFGQKTPVVPQPEYVDPQRQQELAIQGNIAAAPDIGKLMEAADKLSTEELERLLPGAGGLMKSAVSGIQDMLGGGIPKDVLRNLKQYSAESATSTGTTGSTFASDRLLRSLGLTSLGVFNQGLSSAERWIAEANSRRPLQFSSMLITPGQQIANAWQNENARFSQQWLKNRLDTIDPLNDAIRGFFDWIATTGENAASSYAGAGMSAQSTPQYGNGGNWGGSGVSPSQENAGYSRLYGGGGGFGGGGDAGSGSGIAGGF